MAETPRMPLALPSLLGSLLLHCSMRLLR